MFCRAKKVILMLGAVAGFGSEFVHARCHNRGRESFEEHFAKACVDAAQKAR
jgi:hypothetical protein